MKPILDATAGNRMMWNCKTPPNVVFMDREYGLKIPPDIFASWFDLPFREKCFHNCIFDPPHYKSLGKTSIHRDPEAKRGSWWGFFTSKRNMVNSIIKAQKELARVTDVMLFKWNDGDVLLWNILSCFTEWTEVYRKKRKSRSNISKSNTYWLKMRTNDTLPRTMREQGE